MDGGGSYDSESGRNGDTPMMHELQHRQFLNQSSLSLGSTGSGITAERTSIQQRCLMTWAVQVMANMATRAKRIIYLFMHGEPSQLDLFDHKPGLRERHGQELPDSVRGDQQLTGMTSGQKSLPVTSSLFSFARYGQSGAWVSRLLPDTAGIVDDLCMIHSMHTEAINHDPAITLFQTGHQQPGRPSFGAWASYGLGSESGESARLCCAVVSRQHSWPADPLYARLWVWISAVESSGRCVSFRRRSRVVSVERSGIDSETRRDQLDVIAALNEDSCTTTRSGNRHSHCEVRDGVSHADVGARSG